MVYSQIYYKNAVGAFIVFDVTNLSTFEKVQMWKSDLDYKVLLPNGKPIPAVLLANKVVFNTGLIMKSNLNKVVCDYVLLYCV